MDGTLTPAAVGRIFESAVQATESPGWFQLVASGGAFDITMQASSLHAPIRWIEFNALRELGATLADLEALYGTNHTRFRQRRMAPR